MEKLFVPYELAVKLNDKGFNEKCLAYFHVCNAYQNGYCFHIADKSRADNRYTLLDCPLYTQVIDWLREKHGIHIWNSPVVPASYEWFYWPVTEGGDKLIGTGNTGRALSYDVDFYVGLQKAIEKALLKLI